MDRPVPAGAVVLDHVSKVYRVYPSSGDRLRRFLGGRGRYVDYAALDDVTLEVAPGEAVGLIGENGAGKSTLLKLVAGTTAPTAGRVEVGGRVASILELGAAFHPEFTGRENAVLYGALLGLHRGEMRERLDAILRFAELGEAIDHPLKSYSTGMAMRLGFAVATHLDPDVLVIDEALAVGDGYFQKKCIDRLLEMKSAGTTILFCSHSMFYVTSFCDRAAWLKEGRLEHVGPAHEVVHAYEEYLLARERRRIDPMGKGEGTGPSGSGAAIRALRILDREGRETRVYRTGEPLAVEVEWESVLPDGIFHVGVSLERRDGSRVFGAATFWDGVEPARGEGLHRARLTLSSFPVAQGTYSLGGFLFDESGLHLYDQVVLVDHLEPAEPGWKPGLLALEHTWEMDR